jgi:hypothetical protein
MARTMAKRVHCGVRSGHGCRLLGAPVLALCLLALAASSAAAASFTWSGGAGLSDIGWSKGANWGGTAPSGSVEALTFPVLACPSCLALSENDLSGLNVNAISIDAGQTYGIGGSPIALGAGGLSANASGSSGHGVALNAALTLSESQTWSLSGPGSGSTHGAAVGIGEGVTGGSHTLAIKMANQALLIFHADSELGAVSITGTDPSNSGTASFANGGVALGLPFGGQTSALINATDGNPVSLTDASLSSQGGTVGPLTTTGGRIDVGSQTAAGTLTVNGGVTLDPASFIAFYITGPGQIVGSDYSQLRASGTVNLKNAAFLLIANAQGNCLTLTPGDQYTLVSTTGSLVGTFAAANGQTVPIGVPSLSCPTSVMAQINYTANAVTATIVAASAAKAPPLSRSNFITRSAHVNPRTGAITFQESVVDPGTFSWVLTFRNGTYGVFASSAAKCKVGFASLNGKCRRANVVYAKGKQTFATAGTVKFTVKPSASASKALRNALRRKRGLAVSAALTFQSSRGGSPVSHTQSLAVKLKKK